MSRLPLLALAACVLAGCATSNPVARSADAVTAFAVQQVGDRPVPFELTSGRLNELSERRGSEPRFQPRTSMLGVGSDETRLGQTLSEARSFTGLTSADGDTEVSVFAYATYRDARQAVASLLPVLDFRTLVPDDDEERRLDGAYFVHGPTVVRVLSVYPGEIRRFEQGLGRPVRSFSTSLPRAIMRLGVARAQSQAEVEALRAREQAASVARGDLNR